MINFASDNASSVHTEVLEQLIKVNNGAQFPYGHDKYTEKLTLEFNRIFDRDVFCFPVFNGTGANTVALDLITKKNSMILSSVASHISEDECAAPTRHTGCPVRFVNNAPAKVTPDNILPFLSLKGNMHKSQPDVLSISQVTETGEIYSPAELYALKDFCTKNNILVHMDGARLANAAAAEPSIMLKAVIDTVDILTFGGTKNGLMCAEALIVKDKNIAEKIPSAVKQGMQLSSKMRYISAQFLASFENDLWLKSAGHANNMMKLLHSKINKYAHRLYPVDANIMFAEIDTQVVNKLSEKYFFYTMQTNAHKTAVRLITSWDTSQKQIEDFASDLINLHTF